MRVLKPRYERPLGAGHFGSGEFRVILSVMPDDPADLPVVPHKAVAEENP